MANKIPCTITEKRFVSAKKHNSLQELATEKSRPPHPILNDDSTVPTSADIDSSKVDIVGFDVEVPGCATYLTVATGTGIGRRILSTALVTNDGQTGDRNGIPVVFVAIVSN